MPKPISPFKWKLSPDTKMFPLQVFCWKLLNGDANGSKFKRLVKKLSGYTAAVRSHTSPTRQAYQINPRSCAVFHSTLLVIDWNIPSQPSAV